MNRTRRKHKTYSEDDSRRWLTWLAREMQKHDYSLFLMEWLQPSWLPTRREQTIYIMVTRMMAGFVIGLATVAIHKCFTLKDTDYSMPVLWGTIAGIATGVAASIRLDQRVIALLRIESGVLLYLTRAFLGMVVAAIGLLTIALPIDQLIFGHNFLTSGNPQTLMIVGFLVVMTGLIGVRTISRDLDSDIQSVETLGASWGDAAQGFFAGAIASFALGYVYLFKFLQVELTDVSGWARVVTITVVGMVIGTAFHGLKAAPRQKTVIPNEGIVLSVRHALIVGICLGLFGGICWGTCIGLQNGFASGIRAGLLGFLGITLVSGIWFGGIDVMRHYVLRTMLGMAGVFPYRPCPFLEYTGYELDFIKQVGGGYQFKHRYLLEHFAEGFALPKSSPERKEFVGIQSTSSVFRSNNQDAQDETGHGQIAEQGE